jgi:2,3-dihydroxybiphenyl 1,2-dioxygenase
MVTIRNSSDRAEVVQLGYIGLGVANMEVWLDFAQNVLGLQVNGETPEGGLLLRMDRYHYRFELIPSDKEDIQFKGWEVKDRTALESIAAQVRAFGIEVEEGSSQDVVRRMVLGLIKFKDPAGADTEVYYGPRIDHRPFVSPRGIPEFCADQLGLGHIGVTVQNVDNYVRFYTEALGAKMSDIIRIDAGDATHAITFMHVNPRHHSLAIVDAGEQVPPKHLNHFMIEVPRLDDVGHAFGLFKQRGLYSGNLGRHTNDKMFSFYAETPSGFMIEYGHGGRLIEDEENWQVELHTMPSIWGHDMPPRAKAAG